MKQVYAIILTSESEGGYSVSIPDLGIGTQGETIAECIDMARDAIGLWGICEQDAGRTIPTATNLSPAHAEDELVTLVDVDFDAYRRANDVRTVRRTVTLPSYLNELGEKAGLNFSQVLQDGLRQRLGVL
ncbi:type II toxin-antitoxin system HicB family antitoxin [Yeguia hominis]|uniref:Type II toxin-antitoxin system HicB family antitoxin n=1 Tax=Yeguia hominis TaxID=2763662 RepID=A0A926DDH9_9FIRM|nr:type II toxin-antitoxin system HicB family antitoxin [Yeguia hominis]MBC8535020.1 type II toxin-antitoxin system HicB family antitoxin [Yeguia hominis]